MTKTQNIKTIISIKNYIEFKKRRVREIVRAAFICFGFHKKYKNQRYYMCFYNYFFSVLFTAIFSKRATIAYISPANAHNITVLAITRSSLKT